MQRRAYIAVAVVVLAAGATILTESTLALGQRAGLSDGTPVASSTPRPTASATPTPTSTATPTPTPVVTPTPTPSGPTATTNDFVHLRQGPSTNTPIIANLNGGTVVQLGAYVDSQWQQVSVNGLGGYIYKSYLAY